MIKSDFDLRVEIDDSASAADLIEIIYNQLYERMRDVGYHPEEIFLSPVLYEKIKDHCRERQGRKMRPEEVLTFQGPQSNPITIRKQLL